MSNVVECPEYEVSAGGSCIWEYRNECVKPGTWSNDKIWNYQPFQSNKWTSSLRNFLMMEQVLSITTFWMWDSRHDWKLRLVLFLCLCVYHHHIQVIYKYTPQTNHVSRVYSVVIFTICAICNVTSYVKYVSYFCIGTLLLLLLLF